MDFALPTFVFTLAVTIFSVVLHEVAHGYMARYLGDDTAERAGRLTLNPIPHIDPIGSILVPVLCYLSGIPGFAWAKPVPYNPANLWKDRQWGPLKVALAGPLTNLALVMIFGIAARFALTAGNPRLVAGLVFVAVINAFLGVLNLVPVPPFDGFRLIGLVSHSLSMRLERLGPGTMVLAFAVAYLGAGIIAAIAFYIVSIVASPAALGLLGQVWG